MPEIRPSPAASESPPLGRRRVQRGLWTSIAASSLGMVWVAAALGMPFTMFMECMTGSGMMVGLMVTVEQVATAAQIPAAWIAERLRRRMPFWAAMALAHRLLWFVPALLPFVWLPSSTTAFRVLVGALAASAVLQRMSIPVWFSWMGDLVPANARSRFWGYRQSIVTFVHVAAVIWTGFLLDAFPDPRKAGGSYTGFAIVFGLAAVFGVLDIVIHCFVPEPPNPRPSPGLSLWQRIVTPLKSREFLWVTVGFGMWVFSVGLIGAFTILHLSRVYAISFAALSATAVSASVGSIVAGLLWGRVMDRIGARALGAALMIICPLFGIVWFFMSDSTVMLTLPFFGQLGIPQPVYLLLIVNVVAGAAYSGVALAQLNLSTALAPREGRTMAMAVHWSLVGSLGALGPLVGGFITDRMESVKLDWYLPGGGRFGFIHVLIILQALVVWLLAVPFLMRVKRQDRELPVNLLVGNPLRAVNLLVNLGQLSGSASPHRHASAIRRLGQRRHREAISDLVERLDDPALRVREEAVMALGRIGNDEAVTALLQAFETGRGDLSAHAARALGAAGDRGAVEPLVRRLGDSDRETVVQAARALGTLGDTRAVKPLMDLLDRADDDRVIDAAADALADLGDRDALASILIKQRTCGKPLLKRSLAVAAADLVSGREEFYAAIARERGERGADVAKRLDRLHRCAGRIVAIRHEMGHLEASIAKVESAYEAGHLQACRDALFELASLLASAAYGHAAQRVFGAPYWGIASDRNPYEGGFWYIRTLTDEAAFGEVSDWVEPLLGVFFLAAWTEAWSQTRTNPPRC